MYTRIASCRSRCTLNVVDDCQLLLNRPRVAQQSIGQETVGKLVGIRSKRFFKLQPNLLQKQKQKSSRDALIQC
jgi:hypothetical protein